jgi:hypothetical protein
MLAEGCIIVLFVGTDVEAEGGLGNLVEADGAIANEVVRAFRWHHVAAINMNSHAPECVVMQASADFKPVVQGGVVVVDLPPISLTCSLQGMTSWQVCCDLDGALRWRVAFFEIMETSAMVIDFCPNAVSVRLCGGPQTGMLHEIWTPARDPRCGKPDAGIPPAKMVAPHASWGELATGISQHVVEEAANDDVLLSDDDQVGHGEPSHEGDDASAKSDCGSSEGGGGSDEGVDVAGNDDEALGDDGGEAGADPPLMDVDAGGSGHAGGSCNRDGVVPGEVVKLDVANYGSIVWYRSSGDFYAYCKRPGHERCRKNKTSHKGSKPGQGRPLGFLGAWLLSASLYTDRDLHFHDFVCDFEMRRESRDMLKDCPGYAVLAAQERPAEDDEGSEPDECG